jgi:uncharacterized protein YkwD
VRGPVALCVLLTALAAATPVRAAAAPACAGTDVPATAASTSATRAAIVCLIDAARTARGLPALRREAHLETAAQAWARALGTRRPLSHAGRDGSTPLTRIADAGYARGVEGFSAVETLGRSQGSLSAPAARVSAWLRSPSTRRLLLSAKYRDVGVGVVTAGNVATFVVEAASPTRSRPGR